MTSDEHFKCQLDELVLAIEFIDDGCEKAFSRYQYPETDGTDFRDMGMSGRKFNCKTWFKNELYADYQSFLNLIERRDTVHNFIHPYFGLILGVITGYSAKHDRQKQTAVVDFVFEEQLQGDIEERLTPLIQPQIEELFINGQTALLASYKDKLLTVLGPNASALLTRVINTTSSLASQFIDMSRSVRSYAAQVDSAVAVFEGFLATAVQPADSLIASIEYGSTVPGRLIGGIAQAVDRYMTLVETAIESPIMILQSFYTGTLELRNALTGFEPELDIIVAQCGALFISRLYKADDDNRYQALMIEKTPAWTRKGEYVGRAAMPSVFTVNDLERSLYIVRSYLQQAINIDRNITVLHQMSAALLRHVNTIKIEREKVISIEVDNDLPLHLLCHSRGLGYAAAERVLSINPQIENPTYTSGTVAVYE